MNKKAIFLLILCVVVLLISIIITLNIGRYAVNFIDIFHIIGSRLGFEYDDPSLDQKAAVFWNLRFPRVLFAACVGSALSVAGAILQALFRNPLASPNIIGVMQGANFGAAIAILLIPYSVFAINISSFAFGLLSVIIAYFISKRSRDSSISAIVLIGIVISSFFQAGVSLVTYFADPVNTLPVITYRLMGSLQSSTWDNITYPIPVILVVILLTMIFSWRLNIMSQSDEEAMSLGVDIQLWRFVYLMLSTLLVASSVSVCGNIMWIDLIIPHIARSIVGPEHRKLMPFTALLGAISMVIIDTIVRSATAGEIPISIVTSFIGAPFLAFLVLYRQRGSQSCQ